MLLPETKLLLADYANANFDIGEVRDDDPRAKEMVFRLIQTREALVNHLETHYTPIPQA